MKATPPKDPRRRAFAEALAEALAHELAAELLAEARSTEPAGMAPVRAISTP